jgi:hypothetical protein
MTATIRLSSANYFNEEQLQTLVEWIKSYPFIAFDLELSITVKRTPKK